MNLTRPMVASDTDISRSCPICMENYSDTRFPVLGPLCGHSICRICAIQRNTNICSTCGVSSSYGEDVDGRRLSGAIHYDLPWNSEEWKKNFQLLELVGQYTQKEKELQTVREQAKKEMQTVREQAEKEMQTVREEAREQADRELTEIKKKYEEKLPNDVDYLSCSLCHTKEKRERLNICVTCANEGKVELKDKEDKILPFIVCAYCSGEVHSGHRVVKYLPWKIGHTFNKEVINSVVSDGKSTVASMDEVCTHEIDKGVKRLQEWNEQMEIFRSVDDKLPYRECLGIESAIKNEADLVCNASEDTLPKLRMFTKALEDSKQRLKRLAANMNGAVDDVVGGDVVVEVSPKKRRV